MKSIYDEYYFRTAKTGDANRAYELEKTCFPPNQACKLSWIAHRIAVAADLFLLAVDKKSDLPVAFINGIATDEQYFDDKFFENAANHQKDGKNIMLLGLVVLKEHRNKGLASTLLKEYIKLADFSGRRRLVLTCLKDKVLMYQKLGFKNLGFSASKLGNEQWYEMEYNI